MKAWVSSREAAIVTALATCALAAYSWSHFEITTDITTFLPTEGAREQVALSRQLADGELSRTMVLMLGGRSTTSVVDASERFEQALRAEPRVARELAFLDAGPPAGIDRAVYDLYHPRRLAFLAESPAAARAQLTDEALRAAARRLKDRLAQPMSPLLGRLAPSDPLLVLPSLFERLQSSRGSELGLERGRFVTADKRHAVLFLGTKSRAFDGAAQTPLLAGVRAAFEATNRAFSRSLTLQQSGANRFAVRAEQMIKADIQRVSLWSSLGLLVVMFALFRSLRLVGLAAIPLGVGMVAAVSATLAIYGRVHGITLAFGSALLGVAFDYVEHLYCHHAVAPHPDGPRGTLRQIEMPLLIAALTTLVGFLALLGAGFAGLQELAIFSSVGITASLISTFTILPSLLPKTSRPVALRSRIVAGAAALLRLLEERRSVLWVLPGCTVALIAFALPRAHLNHDFLGADRLDPALLAEDTQVRAQVARFEQRRLVIARGMDDETALAVNDQVALALRSAVSAGELAAFASIAPLLPSAARQSAVEAVVRNSPQLGPRVVAAFELEGFVGSALSPFTRTLEQPTASALTYRELAASPLAGLVRAFRLDGQKGPSFVTYLRDVNDAAALRARLAHVPGAVFLDQGALMGSAHDLYQQRALTLLGIGLCCVLLILWLRYRDARCTFAAFMPSVLAAGATVAVLTLCGFGVDLVVVTALLMVVSMGVDYGVFLVDARLGADGHLEASLLSVSLAALTNVLGFGFLAFSEHPLLQSIGLTAGVGLLSCLVLSPTTLILLRAGNTPPVPVHS